MLVGRQRRGSETIHFEEERERGQWIIIIIIREDNGYQGPIHSTVKNFCWSHIHKNQTT